MRIAVLETGSTRDSLRDVHGTYPEMLINLIAGELPGVTFSTVSVVNGEPVPAATDYDGFVIMGSRHSVHDDFPWIAPLKSLVRDCAAAAIPQVGICFGHQLIADALGGKVVHSKTGWIAGLQAYSIVDPDDATPLGEIASIAYHQEQVAQAPPDAKTLLTTDSCPYAGLFYENEQVFSVQCHPEFDVPYTKGLIEVTTGAPLDAEFARQAINSMTAAPNRQRMARAIASALRGGKGSEISKQLAGQ